MFSVKNLDKIPGHEPTPEKPAEPTPKPATEATPTKHKKSELNDNKNLCMKLWLMAYLYFPASVPGPGLQPQSPGPGPKLVFNSSGVQFVFIGPGS